MKYINIILGILIIGLGVWNFTLQKQVNRHEKYWKVMINNSPKEVQDFFNAEVEKL